LQQRVSQKARAEGAAGNPVSIDAGFGTDNPAAVLHAAVPPDGSGEPVVVIFSPGGPDFIS